MLSDKRVFLDFHEGTEYNTLNKRDDKGISFVAITFLKVKVINPEHPNKIKECEFPVDS